MYRIIRCDCGEFLIVKTYWKYGKCTRCGKKLALQRYITYEKSNDLSYLRRLVYHLRKRSLHKTI